LGQRLSSSKKTFIWVPSKKSQGLGHFYRNYFIYEKIESSYFFFNEPLELDIKERHKAFESQNADELISFLIEENVGTLIIDHYFLSNSLFEKVTNCTEFKVLTFYKKNQTPLSKNIINNNPFINEKELSLEGVKHSFLGEKFYGFRQEIDEYKNSEKNENQIFICFGGSDHLKLSLKIIDKLPSLYEYVIVLGQGTDLKYYQLVKEKFNNVSLEGEVLRHPKNFFKLFSSSSAAIITSSTICYEASFLDVPFVAIETAINQNEIVKYLNSKKIKVLSCNSLDHINDITEVIAEVQRLEVNWSHDISTLLDFIRN
jgi:spore coat polysaccharide biosynthesis predicted glycosyltransferase SpsG